MYATKTPLLAASLAVLLGITAPALALDPTYVPKEGDLEKGDKKEEDQGWDGRLRVGASLAFGHSSNVVGQQDGSTFTIGLTLDGGIDYVKGDHDWRNSLTVAEAFSSTPVLPDFVSTTDKMFLESIYSWKAIDWVGPFGRFALDTKLLSGFDHQAAPVDYIVEGDPTVKKGKTRLQLTSPFEPLTLKESVGAFVRPLDEPYARIDTRAGLGAHQVFADGGLVVANDDATPEIDVAKLHSYQLIGAELAAYITGEVWEKKIAYKAGGEVLIPFYDSSPGASDKSVGDQINVELGAKVSFKLVEWASIDYELKALRQPQLVEDWQIQNNLLLTVGYSLID